MATKPLVRTCDVCKAKIDITNESKDKYFIDFRKTKDDKPIKKWMHTECFKTRERTRKVIKGRAPRMTEEEMNAYIELNRSRFEQEEKDVEFRQTLYNYIGEMYGITNLPTYFFTKMSSVFNGTYKTLTRPVPAEDLLDMWTQRREKLLEQAEYDRRSGKEFEPINRVYYDLAILLNRYDKYLAWKEKKQNEQTETLSKQQEESLAVEHEATIRKFTSSNKKTENNTVDISSILDEI